MGTAPVESFIQTDAAVNPGSSGGALINTNGELIGICAAIASPTSSYAGYAYSISSNLVKKVIEDLMKFGTVQRGYLGISMASQQMDEAKLWICIGETQVKHGLVRPFLVKHLM